MTVVRHVRRPAVVTLAATLAWLMATMLVSGGLALLVLRDDDLVALPVLVLQVDEVLPFDVEVARVVEYAGSGVLALGIVLGLLAYGLGRRSRTSQLGTLVVAAALAGLAASGLVVWTDPLLRFGCWVIVVLPALTALALLLPPAWTYFWSARAPYLS